jgi:hypothetical protein
MSFGKKKDGEEGANKRRHFKKMFKALLGHADGHPYLPVLRG